MREIPLEALRSITKGLDYQAPFHEGVIVPRFNLLELACAIEKEAERIAGLPGMKITLHMDADDAVQLARSMRKLALLG